MNDQKRNQAKLAAAIEAMRPALAAASEAAHALEPDDEGEAGFDRIVQLGYITDATAMLCGPQAKVLADLLDVLLALEEPGESRDEDSHEVAH
jgi:hypothetical protein